MSNGFYVNWAVWDAEHRALAARVAELEELAEQRWREEQAARTTHRERVWQAILALVSGVVLPLIVLGILAIVHGHVR